MLFTKSIEGGIIVKATGLTGNGGAGAPGDHLLGDDQPFRQDILIDRRAREIAKDPIDLRGAQVDRLRDNIQGQLLQQVGVDVVDQLPPHILSL